MERISPTTEGSVVQPVSPTLIGTITSRALPSLDGIGPTTLPLTELTPAKRLVSAETLARSAGLTTPQCSYTTTAGKVSLGTNLLARLTTWVDSAFFGNHADASFFCASLSLPASGPETANTTAQKAKKSHFVQRPDGSLAILRVRSYRPAPTGRRCIAPPDCVA